MENDIPYIATQQLKDFLCNRLRIDEKKFIDDIRQQKRHDSKYMLHRLTGLWMYDDHRVVKTLHIDDHSYNLILSETYPFEGVDTIEMVKDRVNQLVHDYNKQKWVKEHIHKSIDFLDFEHPETKTFNRFHSLIQSLNQNDSIQEHHFSEEVLETIANYKTMIQEKEKVFGRQWELQQKKIQDRDALER